MVAITAVFFFGVDQIIGLAVRALFGAAGQG
jgi:preprotein translocase subunit SecE